MTMCCCMCELLKTAQFHGDDTLAVATRVKRVREQGVHTFNRRNCRDRVVFFASMGCSNKDAGNSERKTLPLFLPPSFSLPLWINIPKTRRRSTHMMSCFCVKRFLQTCFVPCRWSGRRHRTCFQLPTIGHGFHAARSHCDETLQQSVLFTGCLPVWLDNKEAMEDTELGARLPSCAGASSEMIASMIWLVLVWSARYLSLL